MINQPARIITDRLLAANRGLFQRIEQLGIDVIHDEVLDTLFIEVGGPRKAVNVPVDEWVWLRINRPTMEVVAAELPMYSDLVRERPQLAGFLARIGAHYGREGSCSLAPGKAKIAGQLLQSWIAAFVRNEPAMWNAWLEQRSS